MNLIQTLDIFLGKMILLSVILSMCTDIEEKIVSAQLTFMNLLQTHGRFNVNLRLNARHQFASPHEKLHLRCFGMAAVATTGC